MKHTAKNATRMLCLILMSCAANATEAWHASTIKWLYPQADGSFVLVFDTNAPACTAVGADKYHYVLPSQNGMTVEGAKKLYAAAMMAMAMDKTVQVAFDDSTSNCYVNRLLVIK
jgi:hypothetical protein